MLTNTRAIPLMCLAVLVIMPMFSAMGGGGGVSLINQKLSGSDTCTILANGVACLKDELYSPFVFTSAPTFFAVATGCIGGNCGTASSITVTSQVNIFDSGNTLTGDTWNAMPAAQTELFGNINGEHWRSVDWTGVTQVGFAVNCLTGSTSATAILQLQYSDDTGATWNNIAPSINIQATNCPNGGVLNGSPTAYVNIPTGLTLPATEILRVVGQNGGGALDNPQFTEIYVLQKSVTNVVVSVVAQVAQNGIVCGTTKCRVTMIISVAQTVAVTANFKWQAELQ